MKDSEKKYISDYMMFSFVRQKAGITDHYFSNFEFKEEDASAYMEHLWKHLKEVWYGLCFAQMREDSTFPSKKIDNLIRRYQDLWLHRLYASEKWARENPFINETDHYHPNPIRFCGTLTLEAV